MVESCSNAKSILGPFANKETRCCNRRVSFDENLLNFRKNSVKDDCEKSYASFTTIRVTFENQTFFQRYADRLFVSILESFTNNLMTNCILKSEKIDHFSDEIAKDILQASFQDFLPAMRRNREYKSIEKLAYDLVAEIFDPIISKFESGLLEYSEALSHEILTSAVSFSAHKLHVEQIAKLYAEKLSLKVFRDFFIHIISDANRVAYHLLGSYEAVSKNQLRTFAENVIENIMKDLFPSEQADDLYEPSLSDFYAEDLSLDIVSSALHSYNRETYNHSKSSIPHAVAEQYASQIIQGFFVDIPTLTINSRTTSTRSSTSSSQALYRRDSCDDGEAVTPRSATGESHWKRGIYHFADQLLYSLTALEKDDGSDTLSELGDSIMYRRVRRWGSCPHIHERPFAITKDLSAWRRKSETIVSVRNEVQSFAEDLAFDILSSVLPSAVKRML